MRAPRKRAPGVTRDRDAIAGGARSGDRQEELLGHGREQARRRSAGRFPPAPTDTVQSGKSGEKGAGAVDRIDDPDLRRA